MVGQHLLTSVVQLVQQHARAHNRGLNKAFEPEKHLNYGFQEVILYEQLQQKESRVNKTIEIKRHKP